MRISRREIGRETGSRISSLRRAAFRDGFPEAPAVHLAGDEIELRRRDGLEVLMVGGASPEGADNGF